MGWDFDDALRIIKTARWPERGKPLENNTRLHIYGDIDAPKCLAVRHHYTDIVTFYPDGRKRFVPWNSNSTKERLWTYGGVRHFRHRLPSFNKRLPDPGTTPAFRMGYWNSHEPVVAAMSAVELKADGTWDLDKVEPVKFDVIADAKALRKAMLKAGKVCEQLEVQRKLGRVFPRECWFDAWLLENYKKELADIDWASAPSATRWGEDPGFLGQAATVGWEIARQIGAVKEVKLKILPTSAVAI